MKLLLDTHALIWWLAGDASLGKNAVEVIGDESNEILISAASAMEISTKFRLGKLPKAAVLATDLAEYAAEQGFVELSISMAHAAMAGNLAIAHKDPFDRILIAQSLIEQAPLVSNETIFDGFGIQRIW
ncbi:MAG: type II toxin-antitoxin system VapC family toxin [Acidobacteriaceae bacterium]|jgi:PIN domain nuclease of toxin-antitoxin system|nr:type II toxin-antitoxin system VapC family toxin [Acidobacteriaceae bacterium]